MCDPFLRDRSVDEFASSAEVKNGWSYTSTSPYAHCYSSIMNIVFITLRSFQKAPFSDGCTMLKCEWGEVLRKPPYHFKPHKVELRRTAARGDTCPSWILRASPRAPSASFCAIGSIHLSQNITSAPRLLIKFPPLVDIPRTRDGGRPLICTCHSYLSCLDGLHCWPLPPKNINLRTPASKSGLYTKRTIKSLISFKWGNKLKFFTA